MGHGHHEAPYKVPDYKIYKVEDCPRLLTTQKALHAQGLHDPWMRNEVWRYNEKYFGNNWVRGKTLLFRGFSYGLAAAVVTVAATKAYDLMFPSEHDHHGHDHH